MTIERQMRIINGFIRNQSGSEAKLTLIARKPGDPNWWIIKTDDDIPKVQELLAREYPRPLNDTQRAVDARMGRGDPPPAIIRDRNEGFTEP